MNNIFSKFSLSKEREDHESIIASIDKGVVFRGTNLWVLIFAIFVASLGLNVNSTSVIIGAMLISPLMGPIMGIGLGMGINDVVLLKKALKNYLVATIAALITSTIFFLLSPLDDAHSEILARTSPTIYDVLIALFGGFAGIIATSSKQKGNVIPGVAIATALMPPLCTAGYGLATFQFSFFFGAFYLFIINTVFIALATFIISRLLKFPYKHFPDEKTDKRSKRIVWFVVIITLVPSLYLGYDLVQQDRFNKNANNFITNEAHFPNDYLLNKKIDAENKTITLIFGGKEIDSTEIAQVKGQLKKYNLANANLEIKQGFAYLSENKDAPQNDQLSQLTLALEQKEKEGRIVQQQLDSLKNVTATANQLYAEIKAQYPAVKNAIIQPVSLLTDSSRIQTLYVLLTMQKIPQAERNRMENWLKVRLKTDKVLLNIQP
ncbi:TIGR00341 family protein [Ferruginibacter sp. HRS2-29]|uniref:TIGR00341 family protein n=1 Tax=Ferruginibacter sp. HRS2-29 TaxID=2487334 RepID=UPI0020CD6ED8|nr:TIGR00341 family protein [Ferruginibacter sp. HRS2-29]MCP9753510.1 TIGR00341 family protein [Ferruginibacter sp. HRS2-29]